MGPVLDLPIVGAGDGYWDSRVHAPDENIRRADYEETIRLMARIVERFAESA